MRQSASWDEFIARIENNTQRRARALREADIEGRLSMIVSLTEDWQRHHSRADAADRLRRAQAKILEQRRLAPNPNARRIHLSSSVRGMLPAIRAGRATAVTRRQNWDNTNRFWKGIERGQWRGRTLQRIIERETELSPQQWAGAHPYGPPVEVERLVALHADMVRMRERAHRPVTSLPPVLSTQRLTRIVAHLVRSR